MNRKKYKVITLCGSTKFKEDFLREQEKLTLAGNVVISVGIFAHADEKNLALSEKILLDDIHRQKIEMADEILVINKNNYIGESTQKEIDYAMALNKSIKYMEYHYERNR